MQLHCSTLQIANLHLRQCQLEMQFSRGLGSEGLAQFPLSGGGIVLLRVDTSKKPMRAGVFGIERDSGA